MTGTTGPQASPKKLSHICSARVARLAVTYSNPTGYTTLSVTLSLKKIVFPSNHETTFFIFGCKGPCDRTFKESLFVAPRKYIRSLVSTDVCYLKSFIDAYGSLQRIFLFKFAKPDYRQQLVVDSGFRCHLTEFARTKAASPSVFIIKLRKYLRTRRVTSVSQIGTDRIIEIQFSEGQYRLFLEFYAGGNIVLTDKDLTILSLFRIVIEGASQEELRIGLTYSLSDRQNFNGIPQLTRERVKNGLQGVLDRAENDPATPIRKPKKKAVGELRKALVVSLNEFPPTLIDHALRVTAFEPSTRVEEVLMDDSLLDRLMLLLGEAQSVINSIIKSEIPKGYIIARSLATKVSEPGKTIDAENAVDKAESRIIYEDFHPFRPQQFDQDPGITILEFGSFNRAVDEFFSSVEAQKLESRLSEREETARKKLEAARNDHERRLSGLQQVQEMHIRKAQAIEANLQRVQEVMAVINGLISQGMDWVEIARLIEIEQARSNAVAEMIKLPLKLFENTVTVLLAEANFDDEADFEGDETGSDVSESEKETDQKSKSSRPVKAFDGRLAVDIDLALSPWSNARQYYDQKKSAAIKEYKTLQSSAKAVKSTEKKIDTDLKKGLKQEKQVLRPLRKPLWFEKFIFFISSENYLVLAGKDAQQSEILYKKYLRKGDVYVHADLDRATPVIIKNHHEHPEDPIPPSTLSQAGTLAVATSNAWDSKAVMAAWWVKAEQVSKITPAGDLLNTGEFIVRDSKTYLPPSQLLLGFGLLFRVSEESKARHLKHRFPEDAMLEHECSDTMVQAGDSSEIPGGPDKEFKNDVSVSPILPSDDEEETELDEVESDKMGHKSLQPNVIHRRIQKVERGNDVFARDQIETLKHPSINQSSEDELSEAIRGDNSKKGDEDMIGFRPDIRGNDDDPYRKDSLLSRPEMGADEKIGLSNSFNSSSTPNASIKSREIKETPFIRGKKGKNRKIKDKYANQDDEDRALALHLLGSNSVREKTEEDLVVTHNQDQHLAEQRQKQKEQRTVAIELGKEAERIRKSNFEKGIYPLEHAPEAYVDLEAFLGTPLDGDIILDILAMCGPWDAIGARCRWRAKLQPGMTKRGKAVKEILGSWIAIIDGEKKKSPNIANGNQTTTDEDTTKRTEEELLRGLQDHEVVGLVPVGRCRVVMGSGNPSVLKSRGGGAAGKGHRGGRRSKKPR